LDESGDKLTIINLAFFEPALYHGAIHDCGVEREEINETGDGDDVDEASETD